MSLFSRSPSPLASSRRSFRGSSFLGISGACSDAPPALISTAGLSDCPDHGQLALPHLQSLLLRHARRVDDCRLAVGFDGTPRRLLHGPALGRLLALAARAYLRPDNRIPRPREHPERRLHHRRQTRVLPRDLFAAETLAGLRLRPQEAAHVYPDLRLVSVGRRANRH